MHNTLYHTNKTISNQIFVFFAIFIYVWIVKFASNRNRKCLWIDKHNTLCTVHSICGSNHWSIANVKCIYFVSMFLYSFFNCFSWMLLCFVFPTHLCFCLLHLNLPYFVHHLKAKIISMGNNWKYNYGMGGCIWHWYIKALEELTKRRRKKN